MTDYIYARYALVYGEKPRNSFRKWGDIKMSKARQWTDDYDQRDTLPEEHEEVERLRAENEKLIKLRDVVRLILLNKGHRLFSPYMAIEKLEKILGDIE